MESSKDKKEKMEENEGKRKNSQKLGLDEENGCIKIKRKKRSF